MKTAILASAALAALAIGASAANAAPVATFDGTSGTFSDSGLTGSFTDTFQFGNTPGGTYDISLSTVSSGIAFSTLTFDGETLNFITQSGGTRYYGLNDVSVTAGTQTLDVDGKYTPSTKHPTGVYDGTVQFSPTVSAAPEPSTWMLMIAGVALTGGALRYSRRNGWASAAA